MIALIIRQALSAYNVAGGDDPTPRQVVDQIVRRAALVGIACEVRWPPPPPSASVIELVFQTGDVLAFDGTSWIHTQAGPTK